MIRFRGIYEEEDKLVFYEVNEGVYLTLDLNTPQQTPCIFFETQIADSLENLYEKINQDTEYFVDMVD